MIIRSSKHRRCAAFLEQELRALQQSAKVFEQAPWWRRWKTRPLNAQLRELSKSGGFLVLFISRDTDSFLAAIRPALTGSPVNTVVVHGGLLRASERVEKLPTERIWVSRLEKKKAGKAGIKSFAQWLYHLPSYASSQPSQRGNLWRRVADDLTRWAKALSLRIPFTPQRKRWKAKQRDIDVLRRLAEGDPELLALLRQLSVANPRMLDQLRRLSHEESQPITTRLFSNRLAQSEYPPAMHAYHESAE